MLYNIKNNLIVVFRYKYDYFNIYKMGVENTLILYNEINLPS